MKKSEQPMQEINVYDSDLPSADTENLTDETNHPNDGDDKETFSLDYVKKLRKECSKYRLALKELKKDYEDFPLQRLQEFKDYERQVGELNEIISQQKRAADEAGSRIRSQKVDELITKIAISFDAVAPMQVALLLKDKVDIDDDGRAYLISDTDSRPVDRNIEGYVKSFLQDNLHLVSSKSRRKGTNTSSHIANSISAGQVLAMTPKQYEQNRDRILKSIAKSV